MHPFEMRCWVMADHLPNLLHLSTDAFEGYEVQYRACYQSFFLQKTTRQHVWFHIWLQ